MKLGYSKKLLFLLPLLLMLFSAGGMATTAGNSLENDNVSPDATKLTVATRHDSTIYQKYAAYFAKSDLGKSVGITSADEIEFTAPTTYDGFKTALTNDFIGASVAWGGGPTVFNNLAADGLLADMDSSDDLSAWISANVSDTIAGAQMKKYNSTDHLQWVAAAISSFGFTVNNATLEDRDLPFPTSWEDLASPAFFTSAAETNIAMGNAPDTTSNTRIYQIILQNFGWEKGWEIIYSMAGNSKIFGGSVETRAAVERGDTAVAMTIDFYGVIAMNTNPDTQYVIPEGSSIVNGDPIAISKNAPDREAAEAFVKYVLSAEGQALWLDDRINRLPVRADAFTAADSLIDSDDHIDQNQIDLVEGLYDQTLANQGIEFNESLALSLEEAMRYHFESTITATHETLRSSWSTIASNFNGGSFPEGRLDQLVDQYGDPAITLEEAQEMNDEIINDAVFRQEKQSEWEGFAVKKYNDAKDAVDDPYTLSDDTGEQTVDTVDEGVRDIPFNGYWAFIALIAPVVMTKFLRAYRNK